MIAVIFWSLPGLFMLGLTVCLLHDAQAGTVIHNDGIQITARTRGDRIWHLPVARVNGDRPYIAIGKEITVLPEVMRRRNLHYSLLPKRSLVLWTVCIALIFLGCAVGSIF